MLNEMRCLAVLLTPLGNLSRCALKSFMDNALVAEVEDQKITGRTDFLFRQVHAKLKYNVHFSSALNYVITHGQSKHLCVSAQLRAAAARAVGARQPARNSARSNIRKETRRRGWPTQPPAGRPARARRRVATAAATAAAAAAAAPTAPSRRVPGRAREVSPWAHPARRRTARRCRRTGAPTRWAAAGARARPAPTPRPPAERTEL